MLTMMLATLFAVFAGAWLIDRAAERMNRRTSLSARLAEVLTSERR